MGVVKVLLLVVVRGTEVRCPEGMYINGDCASTGRCEPCAACPIGQALSGKQQDFEARRAPTHSAADCVRCKPGQWSAAGSGECHACGRGGPWPEADPPDLRHCQPDPTQLRCKVLPVAAVGLPALLPAQPARLGPCAGGWRGGRHGEFPTRTNNLLSVESAPHMAQDARHGMAMKQHRQSRAIPGGGGTDTHCSTARPMGSLE